MVQWYNVWSWFKLQTKMMKENEREQGEERAETKEGL